MAAMKCIGVWFDAQAWGGSWFEAWEGLARAALDALPWEEYPAVHGHVFRIWSGTALAGRQDDRFCGVRPEGVFVELPPEAAGAALLRALSGFKGLLAAEVHPDRPEHDGLTSSRVLFDGAAFSLHNRGENGRYPVTGFACFAPRSDDEATLGQALWSDDEALGAWLAERKGPATGARGGSSGKYLQIAAAVPGQRVVYRDGLELEVLCWVLIDNGDGGAVAPMVDSPEGPDVASWYDDNFRIGSVSTGAEAPEDGPREEPLRREPRLSSGAWWPTVERRSEERRRQTSLFPEGVPTGAPVEDPAEDVDFPPGDLFVQCAVATVGELVDALGGMPRAAEIRISIDGQAFEGRDGLGLFVPPRTTLGQVPTAFLVTPRLAEIWSQRAERRRQPAHYDTEVRPTAGRSFAHEVEAYNAWMAGDRFVISDPEHTAHLRRVTRDDLAAMGVGSVLCRYDRERPSVVLLTALSREGEE